MLEIGLIYGAAAITITHNHPSGGLSPSIADKTITDRLVTALKVISIEFK
ncbi:MAG: DNA repair protein RadC [Alteromonadaceae bacterium]|jgi:DNA repair protein RadC